MDVVQLYNDYSIQYATEGHKHCRPGWVNTECPHCTGNPGLHLSYNLRNDYFLCWRCGWHPMSVSVAALLNVSEKEARIIIKKYGGTPLVIQPEPTVRIRLKAHRLPSHSEPMTNQHRQYLEGRNFDPDLLERTWKLLGTGPISSLTTGERRNEKTIDYKHRIVIPYIWNSEEVSFDTRDITDRHRDKYLACPLDRELIPHKDILYGRQDLWTDRGICVEGPTDVWRFGPKYAFGVSGIKYTVRQVRAIAKQFKRVAVVFDGGEPTASLQARKLIIELKFRRVDAVPVELKPGEDPGKMNQADADYLVKQLMRQTL